MPSLLQKREEKEKRLNRRQTKTSYVRHTCACACMCVCRHILAAVRSHFWLTFFQLISCALYANDSQMTVSKANCRFTFSTIFHLSSTSDRRRLACPPHTTHRTHEDAFYMFKSIITKQFWLFILVTCHSSLPHSMLVWSKINGCAAAYAYAPSLCTW